MQPLSGEKTHILLSRFLQSHQSLSARISLMVYVGVFCRLVAFSTISFCIVRVFPYLCSLEEIIRTMKNGRFRILVTVAAFLLAAVWFFVPVGRPNGDSLSFAMRLALPAALLALGGIELVPRPMTVGSCFCAIGDAMGVLGSFEGQMGGFAIAHICFISQFVRDIRRSRLQLPAFVITALLYTVPLICAALKIIPAIQDMPIRIGCIVYALLLTGTAWTSLVRAVSVRIGWSILLFVGAVGGQLFLVSDYILSWNKFTEHVPHASFYIMSTYYAALLCLFIGTLRWAIRSSRQQKRPTTSA